MCKFKSAIILKDRVFIPDYDSHSEMLDELGIKDTRENAERLFVRAELYPKDNDVFSNIDTWTFNVDQDILPEWFVKEVDKERMISAVKEWAKTHIYIGVDNLKLKNGKGYYIKDCKNVTLENSSVVVWGNSSVEARGNSSVVVWGNSSVEARGNSTIVKTQFSSFNKDRLILSENATFKDCQAKVIYQSGDWKLVAVKDGRGE